MSKVMDALDESPVLFRSGDDVLLGVLTMPSPGSAGHRIAAVAISGGWHGVSSGRNRVLVRLCRRLAAMGLPAFRFDFHGVADSTGTIDKFRLDRPFIADLDDAVHQVCEMTGADTTVLAGVCFGARTGLAYAANADNLTGVALISMPVQSVVQAGPSRSPFEALSIGAMVRLGLRPWIVKDMLRADRRRAYRTIVGSWWRLHRTLGAKTHAASTIVGTDVVDQIRRSLERGAHLLFVYGSQDLSYADFVKACEGPLGPVLDEARSRCAVKVIPGDVHGFGHLKIQDAVIASVCDWVSGLRSPQGNHVDAWSQT